MGSKRSETKDGGATLNVRLHPGASREGVTGMMGDAVKISVTAPPEKGKANAALEKFLARELGVSSGAVSVISGAGSRSKSVRIEGITEARLASWLHEKLKGHP